MIEILGILLLAASVWDMKYSRIPNAFVLPLAIVGIGISTWEGGWRGCLEAIFSMMFLFIILFPAYFAIGGGDTKLLMAMGTWIGAAKTFQIAFDSFIVGGLVFLFFVPPKRIKTLFYEVFCLIFYQIPIISNKGAKKLPFAPIIFLSFILNETGISDKIYGFFS